MFTSIHVILLLGHLSRICGTIFVIFRDLVKNTPQFLNDGLTIEISDEMYKRAMILASYLAHNLLKYLSPAMLDTNSLRGRPLMIWGGRGKIENELIFSAALPFEIYFFPEKAS